MVSPGYPCCPTVFVAFPQDAEAGIVLCVVDVAGETHHLEK